METRLDPWGSVHVEDYTKLFEEFGISSFDDILPYLAEPHRYMRRRIIFGHRNYDAVLAAMQNGRPFAVMSGFMPTGKAHFGHMMVMNEIIWHQQQGGDAFAAVADMAVSYTHLDVYKRQEQRLQRASPSMSATFSVP